MVPKAITLTLVNHSKENLQRELLQELYKPEVLDDLLKESEFVVNRRKEVTSMLQALGKAEECVPFFIFLCPRELTRSAAQDRRERVRRHIARRGSRILGGRRRGGPPGWGRRRSDGSCRAFSVCICVLLYHTRLYTLVRPIVQVDVVQCSLLGRPRRAAVRSWAGASGWLVLGFIRSFSFGLSILSGLKHPCGGHGKHPSRSTTSKREVVECYGAVGR